jgi:hypothetical protein
VVSTPQPYTSIRSAGCQSRSWCRLVEFNYRTPFPCSGFLEIPSGKKIAGSANELPRSVLAHFDGRVTTGQAVASSIPPLTPLPVPACLPS